jgi:hypothetical protein
MHIRYLYPVICNGSLYGQCLCGEMAQRDMTACTSVQTQRLKECEVLTSRESDYFSSLVSEASNTHVHPFNGFLVSLMSQMPDRDPTGLPICKTIHLDTVVHAAHLIGVYGGTFLPRDLTFDCSLGVLRTYYVNKYIDHHAFETAY